MQNCSCHYQGTICTCEDNGAVLPMLLCCGSLAHCIEHIGKRIISLPKQCRGAFLRLQYSARRLANSSELPRQLGDTHGFQAHC